jgi:hypothetical protein
VNEYILIETASARIDKTFRIQRVENIPKSLEPPPLAVKPRPQQPEGLKMRFKPSAFGRGSPGALGDYEELPVHNPAILVSNIPEPLHHSSRKKREREEEEPRKSHKKSKSVAIPGEMERDVLSNPNETKKSRKESKRLKKDKQKPGREAVKAVESIKMNGLPAAIEKDAEKDGMIAEKKKQKEKEKKKKKKQESTP